MKEIDYIFKNLDVKKFLKLIKKVGDGFLATETFKCVKNPNKKVHDGLEALVWNGIFFNKIKDLSLTYFARIESGDEEVDANFNIICFYSKTDKKYRLMTFDMSKGSFKYTLEEIFNNMPTKLEIENKFYDTNLEDGFINDYIFLCFRNQDLHRPVNKLIAVNFWVIFRYCVVVFFVHLDSCYFVSCHGRVPAGRH